MVPMYPNNPPSFGKTPIEIEAARKEWEVKTTERLRQERRLRLKRVKELKAAHELKCSDTATWGRLVDGWAIYSNLLLSAIREGTDVNDRIGKKIRVMSIEWHFSASPDYGGVAATKYGQIKAIFLWNMRTNGVNSVPANALVGGMGMDTFFYVFAKSQFIQFMSYDKRMAVWFTAVGIVSQVEEFRDHHYKAFGQGVVVNYQGDVGDITDMNDKNLEIWTYCTSANWNPYNNPAIQLNCRIRYLDE